MAQETRVTAHKERIDRVVAHIHENLDAPLDMEVLGEIACLSPDHWHRIYREIMGETASQTIADAASGGQHTNSSTQQTPSGRSQSPHITAALQRSRGPSPISMEPHLPFTAAKERPLK